MNVLGLKLLSLHSHSSLGDRLFVLDLIPINIGYTVDDSWQELVGRHEGWFDDEVYESYLTLLDVCCASIHEHRDWYAKLFFSVSLIEELDEKKFNPLPAGFKFLRGV